MLVLAYACEPGKGSEQGVGWNLALQLARFADVTVITRANNRAVIEAAMQDRRGARPEFIYYDPPAAILRLKRKASRLLFFYLAWQWGSYRLARRLQEERRFSHVMQLTFGSIWMPVFAHRLRGDFIWGPIGGGEGVPPWLAGQVGARARLTQLLRRALTSTLPANPMIRPVLARARHILVRTGDTLAILPERHRARATCLLETGVDMATLDALARQAGNPRDPPLTVLFTGRLVAFKNVEMLIHAAAIAHENGAGFRLRIVGDGPERAALESLARRKGIAGITDFTGSVPRELVFRELRLADIYAFPSLREGGPWSLMEAMCAGLPVICLDSSGMSVVTDDNSAIRIAPTSRQAIIHGMAEALCALCASHELRERFGRAGRERMRAMFLWDRKGEELARIVFGDDLVAAALENSGKAGE